MEVRIGLLGYPSTGYTWECDRAHDDFEYENPDDYNEEVLVECEDGLFRCQLLIESGKCTHVDVEHILPDDIMIGGSIYEVFIFHDVEPGTVLTFHYIRPWMRGKEEPLKTEQFLVVSLENQQEGVCRAGN